MSVTIAMYCLLQLYMSVKVQLAPQRPLLKLFAIKAVGECISLPVFLEILILGIVFLTFWQATLISLLATFGLVKDVRIPLERFYDRYSTRDRPSI